MNILKRIFGFFILLTGFAILVWIAYNYLIDIQPSARGRNPLPALVFSAGAIYVGCEWLLSKPKKNV